MRDEAISLCARSREWISLRLDGELSDFEAVLLDAHLASCEECRAFSADAGELTAELRAAPVELPERAIVLPRRRSVSTGGLRVAATAAVAAVAFAAVSHLHVNSGPHRLVISDAQRAAALARRNNFVVSNET